jgi:HTH-type transcriptional regulator / antitoxin HipB
MEFFPPMNQSVATPSQLKAVIPALRRHRGLTQAQLGALMGVSQKRIARIEGAPAKASFDQVARLLGLLGADLVVVDKAAPLAAPKARNKSAEKPGDRW